MELYHILNRGVDKREVVANDKDRVRFIHDLYALNDAGRSINFTQPERRDDMIRDRDLLVQIHAYCLMGNHYHLLVSEVAERGISLFMQKFNMGYSKYFNERYKRTGALWQGKYKKIPVARDAHFNYVPYYIHLNPLDFVAPEWRHGRVANFRKALQYLEEYRWSSHLDYLGIRNFPSVIDRSVLQDIFGTKARYEKEIRNITSDAYLMSRSYLIEK